MKTLLYLPFQRIDGVPDDLFAPTHLVVERIDGQQETRLLSAVMTRCVMRTQQQTLDGSDVPHIIRTALEFDVYIDRKEDLERFFQYVPVRRYEVRLERGDESPYLLWRGFLKADVYGVDTTPFDRGIVSLVATDGLEILESITMDDQKRTVREHLRWLLKQAWGDPYYGSSTIEPAWLLPETLEVQEADPVLNTRTWRKWYDLEMYVAGLNGLEFVRELLYRYGLMLTPMDFGGHLWALIPLGWLRETADGSVTYLIVQRDGSDLSGQVANVNATMAWSNHVLRSSPGGVRIRSVVPVRRIVMVESVEDVRADVFYEKDAAYNERFEHWINSDTPVWWNVVTGAVTLAAGQSGNGLTFDYDGTLIEGRSHTTVPVGTAFDFSFYLKSSGEQVARVRFRIGVEDPTTGDIEWLAENGIDTLVAEALTTTWTLFQGTTPEAHQSGRLVIQFERDDPALGLTAVMIDELQLSLRQWKTEVTFQRDVLLDADAEIEVRTRLHDAVFYPTEPVYFTRVPTWKLTTFRSGENYRHLGWRFPIESVTPESLSAIVLRHLARFFTRATGDIPFIYEMEFEAGWKPILPIRWLYESATNHVVRTPGFFVMVEGETDLSTYRSRGRWLRIPL